MNKQKIIFLHIPKTAGSSLNFILLKIYGLKKMFFITYKKQQDFIDLPADKINYYDVILGHHSFGIHKYISSDIKYITFLRDPVSKVISYYHYAKRNQFHRFYKIINDENISIEEFVRNDKHFNPVYNDQTKRLAGLKTKTNNELITKETLKEAIYNIDNHFAVAGITERFDESILLMKKELGWSYPTYIKQNVAKKSEKKDEITEDIKQLIIEKNQYDIELYNYVNEKLDKTIEANKEFMEKEMKIFQLKNKRIKPYLEFKQTSKEKLRKIYYKIKK